MVYLINNSPFVNRYLVSLNAIKPMCDLLTVMDSKIVQVSLNGLENILRLGEQEAKQNGTGINPYCALIEEAYGIVLQHIMAKMPELDKIHYSHHWLLRQMGQEFHFFFAATFSEPTFCPVTFRFFTLISLSLNSFLVIIHLSCFWYMHQ